MSVWLKSKECSHGGIKEEEEEEEEEEEWWGWGFGVKHSKEFLKTAPWNRCW